MTLKIGVIGYSNQKFDVARAMGILRVVLERYVNADDVELVSGLTNLGIPSLAYRQAKRYGWKTVGIACSKAKDYPCFKVDNEIIVGHNWGDESNRFIDYIDVLIRVGGGKQSLDEVKKANAKGLEVVEFNLPAIKEQQSTMITRHKVLTRLGGDTTDISTSSTTTDVLTQNVEKVLKSSDVRYNKLEVNGKSGNIEALVTLTPNYSLTGGELLKIQTFCRQYKLTFDSVESTSYGLLLKFY